jgi:polyhydroxyalkanoate synthesis regulator phasin
VIFARAVMLLIAGHPAAEDEAADELVQKLVKHGTISFTE